MGMGGPVPQPGAPFGVDPLTGQPFSEKSKIITGILNMVIPGVGRMYAGHVGLGIGQLAVAIVTCYIGALWSWIDGIMILVNGGTDSEGRPLRS